jgi:hypothetical protein
MEKIRRRNCLTKRYFHTSAHQPVSIFTGPHTRTCFVEFKILEQFDAICKFCVLLQTALPLAYQPIRERPSCRGAGDCIYGYSRIGREFHRELGQDVSVVLLVVGIEMLPSTFLSGASRRIHRAELCPLPSITRRLSYTPLPTHSIETGLRVSNSSNYQANKVAYFSG